jgi:hypothetical protein
MASSTESTPEHILMLVKGAKELYDSDPSLGKGDSVENTAWTLMLRRGYDAPRWIEGKWVQDIKMMKWFATCFLDEFNRQGLWERGRHGPSTGRPYWYETPGWKLDLAGPAPPLPTLRAPTPSSPRAVQRRKMR